LNLQTRWFLVMSTAAVAIIAVACGGSNPSSDRNLGDVLVLTPTPVSVTCIDPYPASAPTFDDDNAIAYETFPSGVSVFDHKVGDGSALVMDSNMSVHYTGFFDDGCVFDTSHTRGAPVTFKLNNLIQGWQIGMADMLEGGKRRIRIPSDLAYGDAGLNISGFVIPGGATLIFEVELVEVVQ
jgi:hypothetical protein